MESEPSADTPGATTVTVKERSRTPVAGSVGSQLVVVAGRNTGHKFAVDKNITVGRANTADVQLDDDGLSRQHFRVSREDNAHIIEDLGSRNGTFLNGSRIERSSLSYGDRISVGAGTILVFSRRDALEDRILQAQKLQVLGELSSGIAHDFNNLLSALLASTEYLESSADLGDSTLRDCVKDIAMSARRAMELSNQLLAFARSSPQNHVATNYSQLVRDASKLVRRVLPRTVEIETKVSSEMHVCADRTQILQVLMNLCVNASDAMPQGGTLTIELRAATAAEVSATGPATTGDYVALVVSDTGTGMDPDTQKRALEPFFTTKARGKGTGLGLATADRVIRAHGGRMRIDSAPGLGSRFWIVLPMILSPEPRPRDPTPPLSADLEGKSVLLVEDEDVVRSSLTRVLERAGLRVTCAADGIDAIETFRDRAEDFDLVILDLDLPRASGEQVLASIQSNETPVRILVSSGYLDGERLATLRGAGVNAFLHKPYGSRELLQQMSEALQRQALLPP